MAHELFGNLAGGDKAKAGLFGNPAGGDDKSAELNDRIAQVVEDVNSIIEDAKAAGVYNDRSSLAALRMIAQEAQGVYNKWMEQQGQEEPMEKDNYNPAKVIEETSGRDLGPFSGPMEPPQALKNPNPFGGQVIAMQSPNYGLPKKRKIL